MANRVLRDWTTSEAVDRLSDGAEVLFTRLIMKADDYGSFHSNPKLIKSALFPLKEYKDVQISKWVNECIEAGILFTYKVDGREYLRIVNFGQRLRNMRSTFPQPDANAQQSAASRRESPPETETKRNEVETETKANAADCGEVSVWPTFADFWDMYDKKQDKPKCEKKWNTIKQAAREKIMQHLEMYIRSTPDIQYRKNPLTYLNSESWENEIITNGITKKQRNTEGLREAFKDEYVREFGKG